jgi:hypothetical protein
VEGSVTPVYRNSQSYILILSQVVYNRMLIKSHTWGLGEGQENCTWGRGGGVIGSCIPCPSSSCYKSVKFI